MGFDDFERLVDERGGIDRDLLAHRPGRMFERFGHRRTRDPLGTPGAERAARRGENEPRELGRPAPRHALQDGAVLGIDRDDFAAALTRRLGDQLARHDQRLFICERDTLASTQRRQRCFESRGTDDAVHHNPDIGMRRRLDEAGRTRPIPHSPVPAVDQSDERRFPLALLLGEQLLVRMSGESHDAEPLPLAREHLERRSADRPGGSEDCDADTHITPNMRYKPAAVGITKYKESSRSSTPPWPGISVDESFRPASRLNSDSATSPICPTMDTARPNSNSSPGVNLHPCRFSTKVPSASAVITPPSVPPTAPAWVFLGDRTGASWGPPTAVPTAIAAVSQIQVMTSGNSVRRTYASGRVAAPLACRIAMRNASSPDAYTQPNSVIDTLVSGRRVGPRRTIATAIVTINHTAPSKSAGAF